MEHVNRPVSQGLSTHIGGPPLTHHAGPRYHRNRKRSDTSAGGAGHLGRYPLAAATPHARWFSSQERIQEDEKTGETPCCERSPEVRLEERGLKETGLTELQMEPKIRLLFADVLGKNLLM